MPGCQNTCSAPVSLPFHAFEPAFAVAVEAVGVDRDWYPADRVARAALRATRLVNLAVVGPLAPSRGADLAALQQTQPWSGSLHSSSIKATASEGRNMP
jgi:hypothetical protein